MLLNIEIYDKLFENKAYFKKLRALWTIKN